MYLHIIFNRHKKEDLVYTIKEPHWHECARKINDTWRTFVLKFNKTDKDFETFNEHVENVIDTLETLQPTPNSEYFVIILCFMFDEIITVLCEKLLQNL